jgi:nitrogen fixation protein FixH
VTKSESMWPLAIVLFLGTTVVANVSMLIYAQNDPSVAVETDYYEKAKHYDEIMAERAASATLGWKAQVVLAQDPSDGFAARLTDASELPVEGAKVNVTYFQIARSGQQQVASLTETAPGVYQSNGKIGNKGLWQFELRATRANQLFVQTLSQERR